MNISQDFVKGMVDDGYDYMLEKYDELEEVWPQLFEEKTITGDFWQRTSLVSSGTWRKTGETEGFQESNVIEGFTCYGRVFDYTDAHVFSNSAMKDIQKVKDLGKTFSADWGVSAKETREEFYARVFNKAGITGGDWIFDPTPDSKAVAPTQTANLCYDSVCLVNLSNNTRSSKGGGTYYNGFAYDLLPDNLKTMKNYGMGTNNRRENDTRFKLSYDTLLVPQDLSDTAAEILTSQLIAYNTTNTTNVLKGTLKPITWAYLDDTDAFFVLKAQMGLQALKRQEPVIDFFQDKKNRCWWYTAEQRIGHLAWNWRWILGSNCSTN